MKKKIKQRYFLGQDSSCHWYLVPEDKRDSWNNWSDLDEDDKASWNCPQYAIPLGGGPQCLTFTDPR